jgi:DNA-binding NarL/FixJ family response regulator
MLSLLVQVTFSAGLNIGNTEMTHEMRDARSPRRVVIVDDSRTIQALLDNAFSKRNDFRVVGFSSDATIAAEMIRELRPDVVTIDLCMPYLDGAGLLDLIADLHDVCKIIVSDLPFKNLLLSAKLVEAGAAACVAKSDLVTDPEGFFRKINSAIASNKARPRAVAKQPVVLTTSGLTQLPVAPAGEVVPFPVPADEAKRIAVLHRKRLLDAKPERQFDLITQHVARVTAFPVALLTFIDKDTQWIKSASGLDVTQTHRSEAFCNYTIAQGGPFVVANAANDPKFAQNPLVTGGPSIRCYAGHPVVTKDGLAVGSLCVIDNRVRTVSKHVLDQLAGMAGIVAEMIDQRPQLAA